MHQYIKYVLIIFGSVSIMSGCDNNNNNAVSEKMWVTCRDCKKNNKLYSIAEHGLTATGVFNGYPSFLPHFNRYHREDHIEEIEIIKQQPQKNKNISRFIEKKYTEKITTSALLKQLKKRYSGETLQIALKKLSIPDNSDDSSAQSTPIGSPTIEHSTHQISSNSETESDEELKTNNNEVRSIARTKRRKIPCTTSSSSKPKLDAPQFFPENDCKEETTKKSKIDDQVKHQEFGLNSAAFTLVSIKKNEIVFDALTRLTK